MDWGWDWGTVSYRLFSYANFNCFSVRGSLKPGHSTDVGLIKSQNKGSLGEAIRCGTMGVRMAGDFIHRLFWGSVIGNIMLDGRFLVLRHIYTWFL